MGLVVKSDSTLVALGDVHQSSLLLSLTATLLVAALLVRKTKGALLLGIVFMTVCSVLLELPNANESMVNAQSSKDDSAASSGWINLDFSPVVEDPQAFFTALLCMLFIVLFDTAGVQFGISQQAGLLDSKGR